MNARFALWSIKLYFMIKVHVAIGTVSRITRLGRSASVAALGRRELIIELMAIGTVRAI